MSTRRKFTIGEITSDFTAILLISMYLSGLQIHPPSSKYLFDYSAIFHFFFLNYIHTHIHRYIHGKLGISILHHLKIRFFVKISRTINDMMYSYLPDHTLDISESGMKQYPV